jgi:hypothetical protein
MSATAFNLPEPKGAPSEWAPLLRWLVFTGFTAFAGLLLWRYGLFRLMLQSDRTYISSVISVLYVGASLHCFYRTIAVAREGELERRTARALVENKGEATFAAETLPKGLTGDHIRDLAEKARAQGARRLDQTLLLRGLADRMRGSNAFGNFASDSLMKLGLLGTVIGFIIMLAPIAGLDVSDKSVLKSSMGVMSDGMAVAMYTTLAGLVGSILLKLQYYMLEGATSSLFARVVRLTETRVVPALERRYDR